MDLKLADQVVVIIGGANGIGYAIAEGFAQEQAKVALLDISDNLNEQTEKLKTDYGVATFSQKLDCTNYQAVCDVQQQIIDQWGAIEHVVYAAGIGSGKFGFPFWKLEPEDWDRVLDVNLKGAVNVAHAFAQNMVQRKNGTFLFLGSVAGQNGSQTDPPYSAAKAGIINFAQCAAKDLAAYNVRVNTICPGMVKTDLVHSIWEASQENVPKKEQQTFNEWADQKIKKIAPLGRWQTGQDIASLAVFLASEKAQNITGQTMNVDGGQIMHS